MGECSEKLVIEVLKKEKIKRCPKRIVNNLEKLIKDIAYLQEEAEKYEAEMKLNHEETNFSSWDYKTRVERKKRKICYFLKKALEFGLDKSNEIVESISPEGFIKVGDYISSLCKNYGIGEEFQGIEMRPI